MNVNEQMLAIIKNNKNITDIVREWSGSDVAVVYKDGDVWTYTESREGFLSEDEKASFIKWYCARNGDEMNTSTTEDMDIIEDMLIRSGIAEILENLEGVCMARADAIAITHEAFSGEYSEAWRKAADNIRKIRKDLEYRHDH